MLLQRLTELAVAVSRPSALPPSLSATHALPASEQDVAVWTTMAWVITSMMVHGLSATRLTDKLLSPAPSEP